MLCCAVSRAQKAALCCAVSAHCALCFALLTRHSVLDDLVPLKGVLRYAVVLVLCCTVLPFAVLCHAGAVLPRRSFVLSKLSPLKATVTYAMLAVLCCAHQQLCVQKIGTSKSRRPPPDVRQLVPPSSSPAHGRWQVCFDTLCHISSDADQLPILDVCNEVTAVDAC